MSRTRKVKSRLTPEEYIDKNHQVFKEVLNWFETGYQVRAEDLAEDVLGKFHRDLWVAYLWSNQKLIPSDKYENVFRIYFTCNQSPRKIDGAFITCPEATKDL